MKRNLLIFLASLPMLSNAYTLGNNSYVTTTYTKSVTVSQPMVQQPMISGVSYAMPGMVYNSNVAQQQNIVVNQMQRSVNNIACPNQVNYAVYPQQFVVPVQTPVVQTPTTVVYY